jgi:hypothetical protein
VTLLGDGDFLGVVEDVLDDLRAGGRGRQRGGGEGNSPQFRLGARRND